MSEPSSTPPRDKATGTVLEDYISLSDTTSPSNEDPSTPLTPAKTDTLDGARLSRPPTVARAGTNRLRDGIARRKYARYQQDRYADDDDVTTDDEARTEPSTPAPRASAEMQRAPTLASPIQGSKSKDSNFRRGQQKVRGLFQPKKSRRRKEGDTEIDVLWENQRGSFFFGRPYYSSQSLLNFDPPAWTNVFGKPSPVDITNATLPDPSWEWSWKTWYVDMSLDCDEQGWQYSFMFRTRAAWHGTHPWFHSFARRRRWIRKRVRQHRHLPDGQVEGGDAFKQAHKLNADYFTIHPSADRSPGSSYPPSTIGTQQNIHNTRIPLEEEPDGVDNIQLLMKRLRKATVDREKVHLVLQFMDDGGQDIHYLADEMPHIMSIFMYQYSRKQLLVGMLRKLEDREAGHRDKDPAKSKQAALAKKEDIGSQDFADQPSNLHADEISQRTRHNLRRAVEAADQQLKYFEYWSDIKAMVQSGQTLTGADERKGWDDSWMGLDRSGPSEMPMAESALKPS